jgi:hypothetical protein
LNVLGEPEHAGRTERLSSASAPYLPEEAVNMLTGDVQGGMDAAAVQVIGEWS